MISNAVITGGFFSQNVDHRQVYAHMKKSAIDFLQEAVAHTAFHNSGERHDHPRCHPNTRLAVLDKIEKWALRMDPDTKHASILWLSGAAGAGKSAISQTLAEHFHSKGLLIASFFFGRSDATRNHARSLVSTIVYQLCSLLTPADQSRILAIIDRDPLIFTKSLLAQFETLVVNPLQPLLENGFWASRTAPRLIIIDGLDECLDHGMQSNVLRMLSASIRQFHLPFIFLLASRPEHDIQAMFGSPDLLLIHARLFLDDTYLPDHDIELFLRDQFEECRTTHPFRHMIPPNWPSDDIVKQITRKSSGQFIYASVVAKYIKSSRHWPHHRLDVVLDLRPASRDLPFAELDALYTHIFSSVDDIERVLDIISFVIIFDGWAPNIDNIERILHLDAGEGNMLLCDLASVIGYEEPYEERQLKILHASLADYLLDSARSGQYFIDATKRCVDYVTNFFRILSCALDPAEDAMICFMAKHLSLDLTEPLYDAIREFSISQVYSSALNMKPGRRRSRFLGHLTFRFLPALFKFLKKSDSSKYLELYQHHQSEYDLFLQENIRACWDETSAPLVLALVAIHCELPRGIFYHVFGFLTIPHFEDRALAVLQLDELRLTNDLGYCEYLSDFLLDPNRSQEFCAGPGLFAQAAKHCLFYLCDHRAFAQKAPPRISAQQRRRRKYAPWKWHRQVFQTKKRRLSTCHQFRRWEDVRGPRDTPWLWLRRPIPNRYADLRPCVLHRQTNDLIYIHSLHFTAPLHFVYDDPVVMYRVNSEKYYLALIYLNYFLPRAAKLDNLVHMCQNRTFASRSQDFRRESAQARANMQKYAARWG